METKKKYNHSLYYKTNKVLNMMDDNSADEQEFLNTITDMLVAQHFVGGRVLLFTSKEEAFEFYIKQLDEMFKDKVKNPLSNALNNVCNNNLSCADELVDFGDSKEKREGGGLRQATFNFLYGLEKIYK